MVHQPDYTYLNERLQQLGITEAQNTFTRTWQSRVDEKSPEGIITTKEVTNSRDYRLLDADDQGNIVIHYFNQHGQPYRWHHEEKKGHRDYIRKRLRQPKGEMKYYQEPGSPQFPYFTKRIIEAYAKAKATTPSPEGEDRGNVVHTLFLVEGEIKAIKASLMDIDIIGIPSIHGFYNGDVKGRLHEDIEDVIVTLGVEKIIFLVDADLYSVKWAEGKDLAKRPNSFYGSVKNFRESLQPLLDNENISLKYVYLMHGKSKYMNDAKGLDDLLVKYEAKTVEIIQDLYQLNFASIFFTGMLLNDLSKDVQGRLYRELGLLNEQDFYKTYGEFIGDREFMFKRRRYIYDREKKEVVFVKHEDAEKFMRIGTDWVKVVQKLNKYGEVEEELVSWKIGEIERDYGKKFPDFVQSIARYDDFCNEPNWNGNYKQSINGCYNLCRPLRWIPQKGSISNTVGFLKHLFTGNGFIQLDKDGNFLSEHQIIGDQYTVAMDYITLLFKNPKQMLPVPCLVSPENETGKSTFLKWLQMLFGSNACVLGNAQFQMKFNGHYITKYIIGIDESFLEIDKKAEKERLKQLVTTDTVYVENKGMNVRKTNYYGKVILVSNDADRIMKIEEGETRWFVVRVPKIPRKKVLGQQLLDQGIKTLKGQEIDPAKTYEVANIDPDLELKMKMEAPAFLHWIFNRNVFHPRASRLWFDPDWIITEQFKLIVETTKNRVDRVFEDWIQEQFLLYRLPVLRYSQKHLTEVFNDPKNSKYKIDSIEMKAYLERRGLKPEVPQRIKVPVGFDMPEEGSLLKPKILYREEMGRPYKFIAEEWLSPQQLEQFKGETNVSAPAMVSVPVGDTSGTDDLPF